MKTPVAKQRKGDSNVYRHRNYRINHYFGPYLHIKKPEFWWGIFANFHNPRAVEVQCQKRFVAAISCQIGVTAFDLPLNALHLPPQQGARTLPDNRRCILSAPRFFQLTRALSGCGGVQITHGESGNIKVLSYQDLDHDSQLYYPDNFLQLHGICICRTRLGRQCAMWRREGKSCSHPGSLPERRRYRAGSSLDRFFRNQPQGFITIRQESPRSRMGAG